jgi:hypothetical protein
MIHFKYLKLEYEIAFHYTDGKIKLNVAPFPSLLFSAQMVPPCASIILLEICNPKPIPEDESVLNFSNSFECIFGFIPLPVF